MLPSDTAYWTYMGRLRVTFHKREVHCSTAPRKPNNVILVNNMAEYIRKCKCICRYVAHYCTVPNQVSWVLIYQHTEEQSAELRKLTPRVEKANLKRKWVKGWLNLVSAIYIHNLLFPLEKMYGYIKELIHSVCTRYETVRTYCSNMEKIFCRKYVHFKWPAN